MREVDWLTGLALESIGDPEGHGQWLFRFERNRSLNLQCPWRLIQGGIVRLGRCDHRQLFGLPQAVDAVSELASTLKGLRVMRTFVSEHGDLRLDFDGASLETFTESGGYESWILSAPNEAPIVARGCDGVLE